MRTNTTASYSWKDTREDPTGEHSKDYTNPDPVATSSDTLPITKLWSGGNPDVNSVDITVLADEGTENEEAFHTATLTAANGWATSAFISVGIIKDGEPLPGAMGHDFSFAELDGSQYHWEIDAPVVRPMLINGGGQDHTPTMLIKVDDKHPLPSPTSLAPHERLTDLAVVPREKPHTGAAAREQPRDSPVIER